MKKIYFSKEVKFIFKIFLGNNTDGIRLVGGCVRDCLLNKNINDYDFATIYKPDEIKNILTKNNVKYFTIGEKFGTITAYINGKNFEITTLRKDIKTDGRRAIVEFTKNYREDAERRDFTFNALYMDNFGKIYDFFNGLNDLQNGIVKFIGDAENRIKEDNLRILRFFRFGCYGNYDYNGFKTCIKHKNLLKNLSKERITDEFLKILKTNYSVKTLKFMQNFGILEEIFTNKLDFYNLEIFYSVVNFIDFKYNSLFILAMIFSKNEIEFNFTLSNREKKYINNLINTEFNIQKNFEFEIKKLLFEYKDRDFVKEAIILNFCNNYNNIEDFNNLKNCLNLLEKSEIPDLKITGEYLEKYGFKDKKQFGRIISKIKEIYINSEFKLKKEEIIDIITTIQFL